MVKVMTKQPLVVPRAVSVQLPSAATSDGAGGVTYQELMLDGERVVLEVPDGVTGPDGVIRLLQYVAPDGTIQYMATGDQEGDEMEYAGADGDESTADQHPLIQYVDDLSNQEDEQTQTATQTAAEADDMYAAATEQDVDAVPPDPSQSTERQRQSPITAGSVGDAVEDEEVDDPEFVNSQELILPQVEEHHQQLVGSDLIGSDEVGDCYVCGQSPAVGSAVWMLLEAHAAHSDAPVAELLADALDRELTITSEDVVCAGCLNIANQCDLPGPLQKSAVCYLRNLYELGCGATETLEHPVVLSSFPLKRGPGRPRLSVNAGDAPALDRSGQPAAGDPDRSVSAEKLPSGAILGVRGTLLSGYKGLPGRVLTRRPGDPLPARLPTTVMEVAAAAAEDHAELDGAEAATDGGDSTSRQQPRRVACNRNALMAASVHVHHHEPLLILPPESVGRHVPPPRKYVRRKQLRRAGLMYSRYQQPESVQRQRQDDGDDADRPTSPPTSATAEEASETADETDGGDAAKDQKSVKKVKTVAPKKKRKSKSDEPVESDDHPDDCACVVCAEEADHQSDSPCTCSGCTMMERCRVPVEVAELPSGGAGDCERYHCLQCDALLDLSGTRFRRHVRSCGKASPAVEDVEKVTAAVGAPSDSDVGPVAAPPVRRGRGRPAEPRSCTTCQVRFPSLMSLKKHCAETGHDKRMPCPFCKRLYHPEILKTHKRSHTGAFHCKICNVFFCSKETLLYHMNRHSGARPFKCGDCDKGFRSPSTLFMHHRRNHTQEKPYRCEHCPKRFAARMELEFHTRQHTGVRPFSCQLCDKTYTSRGTLSKHLLTHTQERQYDCDQCGKQFFTRTIYDSHMNMHNNVRPYQCNHCGKTFFSQNKMSRHRKLNCRQARLASTGVEDEMVMTVEVDPECEVRVTSVDEPLAEGSFILAENMPQQRLFTGRRKSSNPYGRLQHPFRLVDGPSQPMMENPHTVQLEEVGVEGGDDVEMLQDCAEQQSEASQEEADQHININIVEAVSV